MRGSYMQITKAKEIEDQVMLRPAVVQKYYNITAIKISRPKNSTMTFVEHDSIIDYFNHGFHENSTL